MIYLGVRYKNQYYELSIGYSPFRCCSVVVVFVCMCICIGSANINALNFTIRVVFVIVCIFRHIFQRYQVGNWTYSRCMFESRMCECSCILEKCLNILQYCVIRNFQFEWKELQFRFVFLIILHLFIWNKIHHFLSEWLVVQLFRFIFWCRMIWEVLNTSFPYIFF